MADKKKINLDQSEMALQAILGRAKDDYTPPTNGTPINRGRPIEEREKKIRIGLAIMPSLYESVKKICYIDRRSISDVVAECLERYVTDNSDKLKEYDALQAKK